MLVWDHDREEDTTDVVVSSLFEAVDADLKREKKGFEEWWSREETKEA